MKKTVTTSFALPRIVHEAFQEFAEAEGKTASELIRDYIADTVGIPLKEEKISQKIQALLEMDSVYPATEGKYPKKRTLYQAFREDRIIYREDGSVLLPSYHKTKCYCFVPRSLKC